ncbi:MAG: LysR family transcriptional regulator [Cytophagales bacterium]|nr:LysR family transcriptional regulator [Cytophagales bacterium]
MSNQIELRHLTYFKVVAEELHFRRAAERLHITQPGLSRQIKQLEEVIGTALFVRDKRSVQLTASGKFLLGEVDVIQNQLEQVIQTTRLIGKGEEGELRIGFVGSAMHGVIPDLLKQLSTQFPKIHTRLDQLDNRRQIEAITHDRLDIGFIRSQQVPEGVKRLEVLNEPFSLVLPAGHVLTTQNFQQISQLRHEHFILFSQDYSYDYYQLVMSIFDAEGFAPKVIHRSVHPSTIFRLVEQGLGVAIVPSSLQHGFDLKVRFISLDRLPQRTVLSAIWKQNNRNPVLEKFVTLVRK